MLQLKRRRRRPARLHEDPRRGSAGACGRRSRAARRSSRRSPSSSTRSGSGSSRATASRECTTAATTNTPERWRFGTVGPALPGLRAATRRRRRAPDPERHGLRRLLQGSRGDGRGARRRRLAPHRATSPRSTRTDSSRSPTARRTSSSPRAARTSPPRTSRTTSRRRSTSPRRSSSATGGRIPAALVTLDAAEIAKWAAGTGHRRATWRRWRPTTQVIALVQGIVDDVNRERSRYEQIKRFVDPAARLHDGAGRGDADAEAEAARVMEHFAETRRRALRHVVARRAVRLRARRESR